MVTLKKHANKKAISLQFSFRSSRPLRLLRQINDNYAIASVAADQFTALC